MHSGFFFTTLKGIEDVLVRELEDKFRLKARVIDEGIVGTDAGWNKAFLFNFLLRSCQRVFLFLKQATFFRLEDLYFLIYQVPWEDFLSSNMSFAIECQRKGQHSFSSQDVERVCGQAVIDRFRARKKTPPKVNLDGPQVNIYMRIRENKVLVGIDTTGQALSRRGYKHYIHPAGLNPVLGYGLVKISGWRKNFSLYDPFCGAGTILIESYREATSTPHLEREKSFSLWRHKFLDLKMFREQAKECKEKIKREELMLYGSDISTKHIEGARLNLQKAKVKATVFLKDALEADYRYDFIVSNLPFGIRTGKGFKTKDRLRSFRRRFLRYKNSFKNATFITSHPQIFKDFPYRRYVVYGNLPVFIVSLVFDNR